MSPLLTRPESRGAPFSHPAFRALWFAATFSYVGSFIQDVGQGWVMLSLTQSPVPVAMMSTCYAIPAFVLLLPAGVMADRLDRRRMLLASQAFQAAIAMIVALLTLSSHVTVGVLLSSSVALGIGAAVSNPPWQSLVPELVPRALAVEAMTLGSVSFNIARAVGPAIGGVLLAAMGPAATFALNSVSFLAVLYVLYAYEPIKTASLRHREGSASEPFARALETALTYTLRARPLRACIVAVVIFALATSNVTALLPVFAKGTLGANARGYGFMVGALGTGAILGSFVLKRVRARTSARALVAASMLLFGIAVIAMSRSRSLPLAVLLFVPAGAGWLGSFSTLSALVQVNAPDWVKSRALALYTLSYMAMWAVGATLGGYVARLIGVPETIAAAGVVALLASLVTLNLALPSYGAAASKTVEA